MSMTKDNLKIGQEEFNRTKIATLPDRPNVGSAVGGKALSPSQMKQKYDASAELIVQRFNALIDALAGYNEQGERIEGVADLIQTGLGEGYSLANLLAGFSSGEAAQHIRVGIEQYSLKGFLEYLKQQLEVVGEDYKQLDDAVGKAEDAANRAEQTVNDAAASVVNEAKAAAAAAAEAAIGDELETAKNAATAAQAAASTAEQAVAEAVGDAEEKLEQAVADAVVVAQEAEQNAKQAAEEAKQAAESAGGVNIFANALKGSVTGSAVRIDDASPIEHEMKVKVSGVEDVSAVKVRRYGKNLLDISQMVSSYTGAGSIYADFTVGEDGTGTFIKRGNYGHRTEEMPLNIKAGTTITTSVEILENTSTQMPLLMLLYADGSKGGRQIIRSDGTAYTNTITKDCVGAYVYVAQAEADGAKIVFKKLNLEIGDTFTGHEPFVEPVEYTPNADGTVEGVTSLSPTTTLMTDTEGAVIDVEYNQDLNAVLAEIYQKIADLM